MQTKEELQAFIAENAAKVAEFQALGGKPRPLTPEENRLALTDPDAFEEVVADRQDEVLEGMRLVALFETAQSDLAELEKVEMAERKEELIEKRAALLDQRYEMALEMEAALTDLNASLEQFQELNARVNQLDRELDEKDRHRASVGLVALQLKRGLHKAAPQIARMLGLKFASIEGWTLGQAFRPTPDPLE